MKKVFLFQIMVIFSPSGVAAPGPGGHEPLVLALALAMPPLSPNFWRAHIRLRAKPIEFRVHKLLLYNHVFQCAEKSKKFSFAPSALATYTECFNVNVLAKLK